MNDGIEKIYRGAFKNCKSLTAITIPNSVKYLYTTYNNNDEGIFYGCTSLKTAKLGNGITDIPTAMFYNCSALTKVTLPNETVRIGKNTFENCKSLTSVNIPTTTEDIGSRAFINCSALKSITINGIYCSIGEYAFENCISLSSVTMSDGIEKIYRGAFKGCTSLESIKIPDSVENLYTNYGNNDEGIFCNCTALKSVVFGKMIKSIPNAMFYNCSALTSAVLPNELKTIGNNVFYNCTSLEAIAVPETVESIGTKAIGYSNNAANTNFTVHGKTGSAAETYANNNGLKFSTKELKPVYPLANTSVISSRSIIRGNKTSVTCKATGGTEPYKYAIYYKQKTSSSWTCVQSYKTSASVVVSPSEAAVYTVRVKVKDADGTIVNKDFELTVKEPDSPLQNTSKVSAEAIAIGKTVTVTCAGTGGKAPYTYAVYYKNENQDSWTTAQNYSTTSSVSIKPKHTGTYRISVKVKDSKGTVVKKYIDVKVNSASLAGKVTLSSSKIELGTKVKAMASATGGTSPYQYAFYYKNENQTSWTTARTYSSTSYVYIQPKHVGKYKICMKTKDSKGTVVKSYSSVTVYDPLVLSASVSRSSVTLGNAFKLTAQCSGGTAPYKYAFYYKKSSASSWTTAQGLGTSSTASIKPTSKGEYIISVKAVDSAGNEEKQRFIVNVK